MSISAQLASSLIAVLVLLPSACNMKKGGAGDGDLGNCQEAVDHIEQDCGIDFDASSGNCTTKDECIAGCITASSCETLAGQDSAGMTTFEDCVADCSNPGGSTSSGGGDTPSCNGCGDYLDGLATYEEVCTSGQLLLDGWAACICDEACAIPCFDNACMGFEATEMCAECVIDGCTEQTDACRQDG